jgi:hypothetical protein
LNVAGEKMPNGQNEKRKKDPKRYHISFFFGNRCGLYLTWYLTFKQYYIIVQVLNIIV